MPEHVSKIAIIGAGAVGATVASAAMIRGVAKHFAIYDINRAKVDAEVLDLNHGLQFVPMATLEGSDDIGVCAGAMELAGANVELCRKRVPQVLKVAPEALLLVVTNPVDVLTYVVQHLSGLPTQRVLGSGTVLDSSRFRFLLARHLNVAVQNVHAFIAGEHGDSEIPLWSPASVGGVPLMQWSVPGRAPLSEADRARIFDDVRNAAYHVIRGKGATHYAIGLATAQILEALLHNEQRVLPVSSRLEGYLGIRDVCMSVPSIVNRGGVEAVLELPLSEPEREGLKRSADTIRQAIRTLGF
jgi:L-lactate dehydrogenase